MITTTYTLENSSGKPSIYLAGPSRRPPVSPSWRDAALDYLRSSGFPGEVFIPEYRDGKQPSEWTYSRQVSWETDFLAKASVILFWIPRDLEKLPGFTTNIEAGEWLHSGKLVIGAPDEAPKIRYLRERCSRLNIAWHTSLCSCVEEAIQKASDGGASKTWFTADTHFSQERTLKLWKRPFTSIADMDWSIIRNWNKVVTENDTIFHLGDFGNVAMLQHLKGKKIRILPGNYDTPEILSELIQDKRVGILEATEWHLNINDLWLRLVHCPMDAQYQDDFYLFGHVHQAQMVKSNGLNVGTDCHNFQPIDTETVLFYYNAILNYYDENVFLRTLGRKELKND